MKQIRALILHPDNRIEARPIDNTEIAAQAIVGGEIDPLSLAPDAMMIINRNGLAKNLPNNRAATSIVRELTQIPAGDGIRGTVIVIGQKNADAPYVGKEDTDLDASWLERLESICKNATQTSPAPATPEGEAKSPSPIKDNEKIYDDQIAPLMTQIIDICRQHKIPILATFEYAPEMLCTTYVSQDGQSSRVSMASQMILEGYTAFAVRAK